jgi:hypothetical protein
MLSLLCPVVDISQIVSIPNQTVKRALILLRPLLFQYILVFDQFLAYMHSKAVLAALWVLWPRLGKIISIIIICLEELEITMDAGSSLGMGLVFTSYIIL